MRTVIVKKCILLVFLMLMIACEPGSKTGTLTGIVTDMTDSAVLEGVRVTIFDANTNAPVGSAISTDSSGTYSRDLEPGTYFVKMSKQGYDDVPVRNIAPLPLTVTARETTEYSVQMTRSSLTNAGYISGTVEAPGTLDRNVLVVASDGSSGFSSVTDSDGSYLIFNVPAGSYTVKGWTAGFQSDEQSVTVTQNTETADVDLTLTEGADGTVTGHITFLATDNAEVDVALTHPLTRETIPGLITKTISMLYTIETVPDGTYLARATYENDGKVMDPDWIVKNGEPYVTVSGSTVQRDFSVTGAVTLTAPTNESDNPQPFEITETSPTLSWIAYPSSSDYVVEVIDSNGTVIWGGFNDDYTEKKVSVSKSQTSVTYNFDGSATGGLEAGKIYRWRIYASKDSTQEPTGWKLISVSEDQMGIIKIVK